MTSDGWIYNTETGLPMRIGLFAKILNGLGVVLLAIIKTSIFIIEKVSPPGPDRKRIVHDIGDKE